MALPSNGAISLNQMHIEVGGSSGSTASLNDSDIRGLISKSSGATMAFNEWYGASNFTADGTFTGTTGEDTTSIIGKDGHDARGSVIGATPYNTALGGSYNTSFELTSGKSIDCYGWVMYKLDNSTSNYSVKIYFEKDTNAYANAAALATELNGREIKINGTTITASASTSTQVVEGNVTLSGSPTVSYIFSPTTTPSTVKGIYDTVGTNYSTNRTMEII